MRAYLDAENAYTDAFMKETAPLQEKLYDEMLGRIQETDLSVPYRKGDYFYYSRTEEGKQYPIYCRKHGSLDAPEEVTLDLNELAKGERFMARGDYEVSDDGNLLAYTLDNTGFREYTLHVKDLRTGKVFSESIPRVSSVAWAADNKTLFYVVDDDAKRPYRLYRHRLGRRRLPRTPSSTRRRTRCSRSASSARAAAPYVLLESSSHTSSEWRFLPAGEPDGAFQLVAPREKEHQYDVDHRGDTLLHPDERRLPQLPRRHGARREPRPVELEGARPLPRRRDGLAESRSSPATPSFSSARTGFRASRITDLATGASHRVEFPETAYALLPRDQRGVRRDEVPVQLPVAHDAADGLRLRHGDEASALILKRTEVLGGYDAARYRTERITATAPRRHEGPDLARLPEGAREGRDEPHAPDGLRLLRVADVSRRSTRTACRCSTAASSIAIAHIRGGGEMGKKWHDQGRMLAKKNTFTDFIAAAETLIAQKYTSKEKLAIEGGSAGGLLMGAVVNMRPDLFHAVIAHVPFVDVINTMLDESLPLTVGRVRGVGQSEDQGAVRLHAVSYSPYDNLAAKDYPAMLVKTSFDDSQVMYWEPAKYVAKLRTLKTDKNPLLFKINMAGGHGGSSGRYDRLRETAFDYAFLLRMGGLRSGAAGSSAVPTHGSPPVPPGRIARRPAERRRLRSAPVSLSPGFRLGPYEILSPLGSGGMGEVYRAKASASRPRRGDHPGAQGRGARLDRAGPDPAARRLLEKSVRGGWGNREWIRRHRPDRCGTTRGTGSSPGSTGTAFPRGQVPAQPGAAAPKVQTVPTGPADGLRPGRAGEAPPVLEVHAVRDATSLFSCRPISLFAKTPDPGPGRAETRGARCRRGRRRPPRDPPHLGEAPVEVRDAAALVDDEDAVAGRVERGLEEREGRSQIAPHASAG